MVIAALAGGVFVGGCSKDPAEADGGDSDVKVTATAVGAGVSSGDVRVWSGSRHVEPGEPEVVFTSYAVGDDHRLAFVLLIHRDRSAEHGVSSHSEVTHTKVRSETTLTGPVDQTIRYAFEAAITRDGNAPRESFTIDGKNWPLDKGRVFAVCTNESTKLSSQVQVQPMVDLPRDLDPDAVKAAARALVKAYRSHPNVKEVFDL
jgi:hypothetical protein